MSNKAAVKRTDFLINKALGIFGLVIIAEIILTFLNRYAVTFGGYLRLMKAPIGFFIVGALLLVCAILWIVRAPAAKNARSYFGGADLLVLSLVILFCGVAFLVFDPVEAIRILYIFFPGCAVLYLVFNLMQRPFFVQAVFGIVSLLLLFASALNAKTLSLVYLAVGVCISILFAIFMLCLRKNDGAFKIGKRSVAVLDSKSEYGAAFITAAVAFVIFAAALILSLLNVALGIIYVYVIAAYYLLLAVYYIIKLM